jgi:hypothetical protein
MIELSTRHAREQFETLSEQTKELTALAQYVATETSDLYFFCGRPRTSGLRIRSSPPPTQNKMEG